MSQQLCPECGASDFIEIDLTLPDQSGVTFCSCHRCENRWWNRDGTPMPLDDVLKLARKAQA